MIFIAMLLTAIITFMAFLILAMRRALMDRNEEIRLLRERARHLYGRIDAQKEQDTTRSVRDAYKQGLYDGRKTDTLYRSIVAKYQSGDRVTVMMDGERGDKA